MQFRAATALLLLPAALVMGQTTMAKGKMMKPSMMDQKAMMDMGHTNAAEIAAGKLALKMGMSEEVKKFAQSMIDDHTMAHQELMALAKKKGVMVPSTPNAEQKMEAAKLMKMKGKEFDMAYWKAMTMGHTKAYMMTSKAAKMAKDPDVKAYFAKYAPKVKMHLDMAKMHKGSM